MLVVFRPEWIWTTFWQWTAFRAVNWWARYCRRQDWWSVPVREWIKCSTTVLLWCAKLCMWLFYWLLQKSNNLIEPAVSSAVAYGRCITNNGLVLSCSDNEALPKGEVWTVRGKQLLLVSYSRGARLDGMNNKCELLLKHRDCRKAKDYWQALPKGMQSVNPLPSNWMSLNCWLCTKWQWGIARGLMKRFYENCRKKTLSVTKTALIACPRSIGMSLLKDWKEWIWITSSWFQAVFIKMVI